MDIIVTKTIWFNHTFGFQFERDMAGADLVQVARAAPKRSHLEAGRSSMFIGKPKLYTSKPNIGITTAPQTPGTPLADYIGARHIVMGTMLRDSTPKCAQSSKARGPNLFQTPRSLDEIQAHGVMPWAPVAIQQCRQ